MSRLTLTARADCRICGGKGTFHERHGPGLLEQMDCDCAFAAIPNDDHAAWDRIERGEFDIDPAPERGEIDVAPTPEDAP